MVDPLMQPNQNLDQNLKGAQVQNIQEGIQNISNDSSPKIPVLNKNAQLFIPRSPQKISPIGSGNLAQNDKKSTEIFSLAGKVEDSGNNSESAKALNKNALPFIPKSPGQKNVIQNNNFQINPNFSNASRGQYSLSNQATPYIPNSQIQANSALTSNIGISSFSSQEKIAPSNQIFNSLIPNNQKIASNSSQLLTSKTESQSYHDHFEVKEKKEELNKLQGQINMPLSNFPEQKNNGNLSNDASFILNKSNDQKQTQQADSNIIKNNETSNKKVEVNEQKKEKPVTSEETKKLDTTKLNDVDDLESYFFGSKKSSEGTRIPTIENKNKVDQNKEKNNANAADASLLQNDKENKENQIKEDISEIILELKSQNLNSSTFKYSNDLIKKILKLKRCKEAPLECKEVIKRKSEKTSQKLEFSPKTKKDHYSPKKEKKITEYDAALQRNQIPEEQKVLEEIAKQNLNKTKESNKKKELTFELNKITNENYEKIKSKIISMISSEEDYEILSHIMFKKAWKEVNYSFLYAKLCSDIVGKENPKEHIFRKLVVEKCQQTFENRKELLSGIPKNNIEDEEEYRIIQKKKLFGTIRFICKLFEEKIISNYIMVMIINLLIPKDENYEKAEEEIELICEILNSSGKKLEETEKLSPKKTSDLSPKRDKNQKSIKEVESELKKIMDSLSPKSRIKYIIMNLLELIKNNWKKNESSDNVSKNNNKSRVKEYNNNYEEDYDDDIEDYKLKKAVSSPIIYVKKISTTSKIIEIPEENSRFEENELIKFLTPIVHSSLTDNQNLIIESFTNLTKHSHTLNEMFEIFMKIRLKEENLNDKSFGMSIRIFINAILDKKLIEIEELINDLNLFMLQLELIIEDAPVLLKTILSLLIEFVENNIVDISKIEIIPKILENNDCVNYRGKLLIELLSWGFKTGKIENKVIKNLYSNMFNLIKGNPDGFSFEVSELKDLLKEHSLEWLYSI